MENSERRVEWEWPSSNIMSLHAQARDWCESRRRSICYLNMGQKVRIKLRSSSEWAYCMNLHHEKGWHHTIPRITGRELNFITKNKIILDVNMWPNDTYLEIFYYFVPWRVRKSPYKLRSTKTPVHRLLKFLSSLPFFFVLVNTHTPTHTLHKSLPPNWPGQKLIISHAGGKEDALPPKH